MTSTPAPIVPQREHAFQNLVASVTGPDARAQPADTGEITRFRRRLALGAAQWRRCFVTRAAGAGATGAVGEALEHHRARAAVDWRAVGLNGHWDVSWTFHPQPPPQRFYGTPAPTPAHLAAQALELAASSSCHLYILLQFIDACII
jgi:hypothetical protein